MYCKIIRSKIVPYVLVGVNETCNNNYIQPFASQIACMQKL